MDAVRERPSGPSDPRPEDAALHVDGLTKTFGDGPDAVTAVDDVSFSIEPGSIVGLLGPNGAGKTTTIKSILRLVVPDEGTAYVDGIDVSERPNEAFGEVSSMLEGARNDYWRLTVRENLRYFGVLGGDHPGTFADRHEDLLEKLDLEAKADEQVRDLSRGMKQKVSLASVLASDVSLAFLDEPTLGLDVESALTLRRELTRIVDERDLTVVLSSHDMDVIEDVCDRVIIMSDGRVIADEDVESLIGEFDTRGYRVAVDDPDGATVDALGDRYPIEGVERFDGRVRFDLTADNETFYDLMADLRGSEATLAGVETIQPDLEEVFLDITGGDDG